MRSSLFFLLPLYLLAGELHVTKTASITTPPDSASFLLSAISENSSAEVALRETAAITERIQAALKSDGSVTTDQFQLFPVQHEKGEATYRAQHTLRVETDTTQEVGKLIDKAVLAGATQINQILFTSKNQAALRQEVIQSAVKAATEEAKILADAASLKLSSIKRISLDQSPSNGPILFAKSTAIIPGDVTLSATVDILFKIE